MTPADRLVITSDSRASAGEGGRGHRRNRNSEHLVAQTISTRQGKIPYKQMAVSTSHTAGSNKYSMKEGKKYN